MFKISPARIRSLFVVVLLSCLVAPLTAEAKGFSGKYTGVMVISQGASTRLVGSANVTAKPNGNIVIKGTVNNVAFTQVIKLGPGRKATVSALLPGIAGFTQSVSGTYAGKKNASIVAPFERTAPGDFPNPGTLRMKIGKTTFGSTLSIQTQLSFQSGGTPVYVTIVAS
jgi:hypothetical protein